MIIGMVRGEGVGIWTIAWPLFLWWFSIYGRSSGGPLPLRRARMLRKASDGKSAPKFLGISAI